MINWIKYDPANPPSDGEYLVTDGIDVDCAIHSKIWSLAWDIREDSRVDGAKSVTHYAHINLPGEETDNA